MGGPLRPQQNGEIFKHRRVGIGEHRLRRRNHAESLEPRQVCKRRNFSMLHAMSPPGSAICFRCVFEGIQGHVDRSVADGV